MKKDSIIFMLKSHGVNKEHIELFIEKLKNKNFTIDDCDKLLEKLDYERIFTSDEDEYLGDYEEYSSFEPNQTKKQIDE